MGNSSKYIIAIVLLIGFASCVHFLSLLVSLPVAVPALLTAAGMLAAYKWFLKKDTSLAPADGIRISAIASLVFVYCLGLMGKNIIEQATKHGDWDAWAIWNLHTRYLTDVNNWRNLFLNTDSEHPDYPLCLPSFIALLIRLASNHFSLIITFIVSMAITMAAPLLIFTETVKKSLTVALLSFFLFSQDVFYITRGVAQYADTLLALFFLCAFVCMNYAADNKKYLVLCAGMLACCTWTKNEGVILATIFFLFYARTFFSLKNIRYTLIGIALPLITLVLFKLNCHSENDMVTSLGNNTLHRVLETARYKVIYQSFMKNLDEKFYYVKVGIYILALIAVIRKQRPSLNMMVLLTCIVAYIGIYIVTPRDLEWHLETSQSRLMHQLMPAMVYIIALKLSGSKLPYPNIKTFKV